MSTTLGLEWSSSWLLDGGPDGLPILKVRFVLRETGHAITDPIARLSSLNVDNYNNCGGLGYSISLTCYCIIKFLRKAVHFPSSCSELPGVGAGPLLVPEPLRPGRPAGSLRFTVRSALYSERVQALLVRPRCRSSSAHLILSVEPSPPCTGCCGEINRPVSFLLKNVVVVCSDKSVYAHFRDTLR